jgi:hypothetical protein
MYEWITVLMLVIGLPLSAFAAGYMIYALINIRRFTKPHYNIREWPADVAKNEYWRFNLRCPMCKRRGSGKRQYMDSGQFRRIVDCSHCAVSWDTGEIGYDSGPE